MHHFTPALEYINTNKQYESIQHLISEYKQNRIQRVDYAFSLMKLPVDAYSILCFRQIYNEIKRDKDTGEREMQQLRTTINCYSRFLQQKIDLIPYNLEMTIRECGATPFVLASALMVNADCLYLAERFEFKMFKPFWFGMDFRALPALESESPVRSMSWDLHRVGCYIPTGAIKTLVRSINQLFRQAYTIVTPEFLLMPEHMRGMIMTRSRLA